MGRVCWHFPLLTTGNLSGVNDAGITMFRGGTMDSLVREVCQNSLDARSGKIRAHVPVKVKIKLSELERRRFSMFEELREAVADAFVFWNENDVKNQKIFDFLAGVKKYLENERIPVLTISDYNTTGLTGVKPAPGVTSCWNTLVNSVGISNKQGENSAGSFGIGKNAPFAYSRIRTVFYNTLAEDGGRAFEGVTRWMSTLKEYGRRVKSKRKRHYKYL